MSTQMGHVSLTVIEWKGGHGGLVFLLQWGSCDLLAIQDLGHILFNCATRLSGTENSRQFWKEMISEAEIWRQACD